MNLPAWLIPALVAFGVIFAALSQLGGPRGANQPYPSRSWAWAALVCGIAAALLIFLSVAVE